MVPSKKNTKPAAKVVEDSDDDDDDDDEDDDYKLVDMESDSDDEEEVDLEKVMKEAAKKAKTSAEGASKSNGAGKKPQA